MIVALAIAGALWLGCSAIAGIALVVATIVRERQIRRDLRRMWVVIERDLVQ